MAPPVRSNKFLDKLVNSAVDQLDSSLDMLELQLTDKTRGASEHGMNPNSEDVLHQLTGETVDRIRAAFERSRALHDKVSADLAEVRRIRTAQG